jgi:hypothetical protein
MGEVSSARVWRDEGEDLGFVVMGRVRLEMGMCGHELYLEKVECVELVQL